MTVNMELVNKVFEAIRSHPRHWDQSLWFEGDSDNPESDPPSNDPMDIANSCGTYFCFAGWALLLSGNLKYEFNQRSQAWHLVLDKNRYDVGQMAAELLGFNYFEAEKIFHELGHLGLDDFETRVRRILG